MLSFINNKSTDKLQYTESGRYVHETNLPKYKANLKVIRNLLCKDNTYHEDKPNIILIDTRKYDIIRRGLIVSYAKIVGYETEARCNIVLSYYENQYKGKHVIIKENCTFAVDKMFNLHVEISDANIRFFNNAMVTGKVCLDINVGSFVDYDKQLYYCEFIIEQGKYKSASYLYEGLIKHDQLEPQIIQGKKYDPKTRRLYEEGEFDHNFNSTTSIYYDNSTNIKNNILLTGIRYTVKDGISYRAEIRDGNMVRLIENQKVDILGLEDKFNTLIEMFRESEKRNQLLEQFIRDNLKRSKQVN